MATGIVSWSQTAANNATADSTANWAEGMAPSAVNDSARAMMASAAKYRDDISGAIVTGGTSTAFTVTSYQGFLSLSALANQVIAFTPHTTCGSTVTLNVDSLGAKPLRTAPSVELVSGTIIQGTPYLAVYNSSDQAFYLQSSFGNPYNIPIGSSIDFWGSTSPNSSFVLMYGQAISRTTYATLFSMFSTTYGSGDGSTTFNVPDLRGRVIAGKDDMGGSAASRLTSTYFGASAASLGAVGGLESHPLTVGQHATLTSSGTVTVNVSGGSVPVSTGGIALASASTGSTAGLVQFAGLGVSFTSLSGSNSLTTTGTGGTTGAGHNNTQPTIIANKLLRII